MWPRKKRIRSLLSTFFSPLHNNCKIFSLNYMGDVLSQTAGASECQNVSISENAEDKIFHTQYTRFWPRQYLDSHLRQSTEFYLTGRKLLIVSLHVCHDIHNSYWVFPFLPILLARKTREYSLCEGLHKHDACVCCSDLVSAVTLLWSLWVWWWEPCSHPGIRI